MCIYIYIYIYIYQTPRAPRPTARGVGSPPLAHAAEDREDPEHSRIRMERELMVCMISCKSTLHCIMLRLLYKLLFMSLRPHQRAHRRSKALPAAPLPERAALPQEPEGQRATLRPPPIYMYIYICVCVYIYIYIYIYTRYIYIYIYISRQRPRGAEDDYAAKPAPAKVSPVSQSTGTSIAGGRDVGYGHFS